MNHNYIQVIVCVLLSISGYSASIAQSSGPDFLDCSSTPDSLCVQDEGVRLPSNNQLFLGEEDPDATSCSVHISRTKQITTDCGNQLHYRVELFLNDTGAAIILQPLTTVSIDSSGQATLFFDTELSPDSLIQLGGIPYQNECNVYHRIVWIVVDSCGLENSCTSNVHLFDCGEPIATLYTSPITEVMPSGCQLTLYARDFYIGGRDDCSLSDQFEYSFEEDWYNPDSISVCPPAFGVEVPGHIWIGDEGVDQNCDGQIAWTERNRVELPFMIIFIDNNGVCCEPDLDSILTGEIITVYRDEGINQVNVSLLRTGTFFPTYVTGPDGRYTFHLMLTGQETTIVPEKNDRHRNGVSTLDLVKIQKHLLGIEPFNAPFQYIAADANNSQHVSAIDLIELRKLILGIYTELPQNQSWRFVAKDFGFPDTLETWTYASTITFTDMLPANADFYGIKIGDINGTANPDFAQILPRESLVPFELKTDQQFYIAGDIIDVPIRISSDQKLTGFQFTLAALGIEFLNILPGQISISEEHFAIHNDKMSVSWFEENTIDVSAEDILFTLQLRATTSGNIGQALSINSEITEAEIYLANEETFLPFLNVHGQHAESDLKIISCAPNPWKEETMIHFYLPESNQVDFTLSDVSGREIFSTNTYLKSGYHQHQLKASDFQGRGILFLRISTSNMSEVTKLIIVE